MKKLEKLERVAENIPGIMYENMILLPGIWWGWLHMDSGKFGNSEDTGYEVYWQPLCNNFIITTSSTSKETSGENICDSKYLFDAVNGLDEIAYACLCRAINQNKSTIVHCYYNEMGYCYDIYYDAWDIDNAKVCIHS